MQDRANETLELLLVSRRIRQLQDNPIQGRYDAAHLKEVHRYLFQDFPKAGLWRLQEHNEGVQPGEFRKEVESWNKWSKERSLVSIVDKSGKPDTSYIVYSQMDSKAIEKLNALLEGARPENFKGLNEKAFVEKISTLYHDLDYLHPFPEGNSRTLRTFTDQLAREVGYELHWEKLNSQKDYDLLYIARDRGVAARAVQDHDPNHPEVREARNDAHRYQDYPGLSQLLEKTVEKIKTQERYAPRHDLARNPAEMHVGARARVPENIEALTRRPALSDRTQEDLEKLAYMRGVVQENVRNLPKDVQDAVLERFDKNAEDPSALERMIEQRQEKAAPEAEAQTRKQERDDDG